MKIEELSIGDFLLFTDGDCAVRVEELYNDAQLLISDGDSISEPVHLTHLHPIPLTPEILEKNGWSEFSDYHNSWKLDIASDKRVWMFKNSHDWTFQVMNWGLGYNHSVAKAYIKHIHELQHALRLAGIEKEIGL